MMLYCWFFKKSLSVEFIVCFLVYPTMCGRTSFCISDLYFLIARLEVVPMTAYVEITHASIAETGLYQFFQIVVRQTHFMADRLPHMRVHNFQHALGVE